MVSTYPDGDNAHTGFSPPKAESSFELSNSSEASLTGGPQSRGHPTVTPMIGRALGSNAPGTIAMDHSAYRKIDSRRGRGRTPRPESTDEEEEYEASGIIDTIRRAITRYRSDTPYKPAGKPRSSSNNNTSLKGKKSSSQGPSGPGRAASHVSDGNVDPAVDTPAIEEDVVRESSDNVPTVGPSGPDSAEHLLCHFPKRADCPSCQVGKAARQRKSRKIKFNQAWAPKKFGDKVTADTLIAKKAFESGPDPIDNVMRSICSCLLRWLY